LSLDRSDAVPLMQPAEDPPGAHLGCF
jgi:hypothetical protein